MAEAVKRKKKLRGGHKSYVTPTFNPVNELLESHQPTMANQPKMSSGGGGGGGGTA